MDDRIMDKLLRNPNVTDVTDDKDVSDVVNEYDSSKDEEPIDISLNTDNTSVDAIIFNSMDGHQYFMDKNAINWDETMKSESDLRDNLMYVQSLLRSVLTERGTDGTENAEYTLTTVRRFIEEFGFTPKYNEAYPDAQVYDYAICYCIDAIEIMHLMLEAIVEYKGSKFSFGNSILNSLINSITNEEELENEDPVQED